MVECKGRCVGSTPGVLTERYKNIGNVACAVAAAVCFLLYCSYQQWNEPTLLATQIVAKEFGPDPETQLPFEAKFKTAINTSINFNDHTLVVALLGPKGVGKTALLQHMYKETKHPAVFLEYIVADTNIEHYLYQHLRRATGDAINRPPKEAELKFLRQVFDAVRSQAPGLKPLVFVDLTYAKNMYDFHHAARNLAERAGITIVFTTSDGQAVLNLRAEPRNQVLILPELSLETAVAYAREVLSKKAEGDEQLQGVLNEEKGNKTILDAIQSLRQRDFVGIRRKIERLVRSEKTLASKLARVRMGVESSIKSYCLSSIKEVVKLTSLEPHILPAYQIQTLCGDGALQKLLEANIFRPTTDGGEFEGDEKLLVTWYSDFVRSVAEDMAKVKV